VRVVRLAVQIARPQWPDYASKFAPKRSRQPSLLACLCLKAYLPLDYRGTEALLASAQQLQEALGLPTVPDPSTRWWFSRHQVKPRLPERLLTETVRLFARAATPYSRTGAVESTGCARAPTSPDDQLRAGKRYRARTWLKSSVAVCTGPPGAVWTGRRPGTARGPGGLAPLGGTSAGSMALHAPAGRWR
jgi:hypothetical protein